MLRISGFFKKEVYYDLVCLKNALKYLCSPSKYILLKTSIKYSRGKVEKFNWGDDISFILVGALSEKIPLFYPNTRISRLLPIKTYMTIGSIMTYFSLNHTIVWGSGIINPNDVHKLSGNPDKIYAVRGPHTRELLLQHGIDCPEIYGDPALLFPMIYNPIKEKKWVLGIVPHYIDSNKEVITTAKKDFGIKVINVQGYEDWRQFINEICSCDMIISSSLHGLIISEAYGVPSIWVKFGSYVDGWDFKFKDFYASINKPDTEALQIDDNIDLFSLQRIATSWQKGSFDALKLLQECPFHKKEFEFYEK